GCVVETYWRPAASPFQWCLERPPRRGTATPAWSLGPPSIDESDGGSRAPLKRCGSDHAATGAVSRRELPPAFRRDRPTIPSRGITMSQPPRPDDPNPEATPAEGITRRPPAPPPTSGGSPLAETLLAAEGTDG